MDIMMRIGVISVRRSILSELRWMDMGGCNRWWDAPTLQQKEHVQVVGWENPTKIKMQQKLKNKE